MNGDVLNKLKFRGIFSYNKYIIIFVLIWFLLITGGTYAYYAFQVREDSVIVGNVIAIDVDLEVELVVGSNNKLVPMTNAALSNALNGVGSTNGACVDSVGNLSCQVYKITLMNNGSRLKNLVGTVELYAKEGIGNVYNNLKWRELTNATTVKTNSVINGMNKSTLVSDLTIESKEVKVWYIAVWISDTDADQLDTDKGDFGGTVTFESGTGETNVFTETILAPNAIPDENIDFSKTSEATSTNGIYVRNETRNDKYPIYYYRGQVNNNLIFANTCWKVVRTTETGGLKLIYNGAPTNGQCNNTGAASRIGNKEFNSSYDSAAYVGYMYSSPYSTSYEDLSSSTDIYYYANDVTYSNGTYTLVDSDIKSGVWTDIYSELGNYHYTCFSTSKTCENVYYMTYIDEWEIDYITLTGGKKVEDALTEMLGADDENTDNYNTISSAIKGNNTTEGTLDWWYYTNIEQKGYSSYIEDTVWCNDRTISSLGTWDPDGGSLYDSLVFSANKRTYTTREPSLTCTRKIDSFTVNEENGNGDLDYPVGLLTSDEIMLAGGINSTNKTYYLYSGIYYWAGSPFFFGDYYDAYVSYVNSFGHLVNYFVSDYYGVGVRPSVSLKPGFSLTGNGNGTAANPYVVE